jgi:4-nitrophenyl phosphatase
VVMEKAGVSEKEKVVIIGDQLETDIRMGNEEGIESILVLTGISTREDVKRTSIKPSYIVENLLSLL